MLLAVLDLALGGGLASNRIVYGPALLERYRRLFAAVASTGDHANPYFPFFHLTGKLQDKTVSFWHLQALPGREAVVEAMSTARGDGDILNNIAWAWLDDDLFALLQDTRAVVALSDTLTTHWFERGMAELQRVAGRCHEVSRYERMLRDGARAIELATKACEETQWEEAHIISTLAAGYAEKGDFTKACEYSQKAVLTEATADGKVRGKEVAGDQVEDVKQQLKRELASYEAQKPWREKQVLEEATVAKAESSGAIEAVEEAEAEAAEEAEASDDSPPARKKKAPRRPFD